MSHSFISIRDFIPSPDPVEEIVVGDDEKFGPSNHALMVPPGEDVQILGLTLSNYKYE